MKSLTKTLFFTVLVWVMLASGAGILIVLAANRPIGAGIMAAVVAIFITTLGALLVMIWRATAKNGAPASQEEASNTPRVYPGHLFLLGFVETLSAAFLAAGFLAGLFGLAGVALALAFFPLVNGARAKWVPLLGNVIGIGLLMATWGGWMALFLATGGFSFP